MVLETPILPYFDWLVSVAPFFLRTVLLLGLAGLVFGVFVATVRYGPIVAGDMAYRVVTTGLKELVRTSPRRVAAITYLTIKESIRGLIAVVFIVFLVVLMFANWFLAKDAYNPLTLNVSFMLSASMFLILILAVFLSAFSLPTDFKNKTIYTIMTKPVLTSEIVLGRILGITLVGSVILAIMGVCSYFFVVRSVQHRHTVEELTVSSVGDGEEVREGVTSSNLNHRHEVILGADGVGQTSTEMRHWHEVRAVEKNGKTVYEVGSAEGLFQARVPIYGQLRFRNSTGDDAERGISVGDEWAYRSYIEGGTLAAAIWTFDDVTPERFPEGLPIEMYVRVYRSYMGNIEKGISGSLVLRNPDTGLTSAIRTFSAKDFYIDKQSFPRKLTDSKGNEIDLFEDLVATSGKNKGKIEIWLQCLDRSQYYGVAQADVYLRAANARFEFNFFKAYLSIGVQMVMLICFGVLFSTFLNGPISLMSTVGITVLGFNTKLILDVATGNLEGGGPLESLIRTFSQKNLLVELEPTLGNQIAIMADVPIKYCMEAAARILPDMRSFSTSGWVADGFNIPGSLILQQITIAFAYLVCVTIIGYFFLRLREIAK